MRVLLLVIPWFLLASHAFAAKPKEVIVVNTPIPVEGSLSVDVSGPVDVTGSAVVVANANADPVPVTVVDQPATNSNPALPKNPLFAFKNAENGGAPILLGPFAPGTRIAIGSVTFDGGDPTFGTQVRLSITNCNNSVLELGPAYIVRNNAAGLGPQHMAFPVPVVFPLQQQQVEWCLQAIPATPDQTLITVVGYLIE